MNTPFGFNPFSTPRTPKGYARLSSDAEPVSPLARFNLRRASGGKGSEGLGELPSLRVWKETCKAFHENTSHADASSAILSKTTIPKNTNKSKSPTLPPTSTSTTTRPYPFGNVMLLEDRDVFRVSASTSDEEGESGDSFNVYATKRRCGGAGRKTK